MRLKCRFIGHDYNLSKKEPSQTFRIPCDTDNPAECIKRTTKTSHYKCSRCDSRKSEDLVNDEIVIVDWKKEQVDSEADEHTKERRTSEQAHQEAKQREGVDNEADDLTTEQKESYQAHQKAKQREPPVDIGDMVKGGVTDLIPHHSGRVDAIIRVKSFVVFVNDVSDDIEQGDVIQAKIMSFGGDMRCAHAMLQDTSA